MCRWGGIVSGARFWGAFLGLISGADFWGWFLGLVSGFAPGGDVGAPFTIPEIAQPAPSQTAPVQRRRQCRPRFWRPDAPASWIRADPRNEPQKPAPETSSQPEPLPGRVSGVRGRGCRRRLRDSGDGAPCGLADGPCDLALPTAFLAAGRAGIMDSRGPQKRAPETSPRNEFSVVGARPAESNGMPGEGLEPSSRCRQRILSPPCLPFHHPGRRGR